MSIKNQVVANIPFVSEWTTQYSNDGIPTGVMTERVAANTAVNANVANLVSLSTGNLNIAKSNFGNANTLHITGGRRGRVLQTSDGLGNLTWASIPSATATANVANIAVNDIFIGYAATIINFGQLGGLIYVAASDGSLASIAPAGAYRQLGGLINGGAVLYMYGALWQRVS